MNAADLQKIADSIDAGVYVSIYSFDILPDGSFSEIRIMAANDLFGKYLQRPGVPELKPGLPYRLFWEDINFEKFCYKCASSKDPLYSYVNAHGAWITGMYIPLRTDEENTVYCLYILKVSLEPESEKMTKRSPEIASAVLDISVKLHKNQDFEKNMTEIVHDIAAVCNSEFCSLYIVSKSDKSCEFISAKGGDSSQLEQIAKSMGRTPYEAALAWEKALAGSDCILLDDLSIIKERDPLWYKSLTSYNIRSIVLYALTFNNELVGFIWAANFSPDRIMKIKEVFELSAYFLGAVIANHQLLGKLEFMSMVDMLTGVCNRNAMNKRVDNIVSGKDKLPDPMGVVFADLNGLKTVNDVHGHDAGDALLGKSASLMRSVFGEYEIYRSGGDEFVIFCPGITETSLGERTAELRKLADDTPDVSFAVGTGYFTGEYDICRAMQTADERMYADKQEYYRLHPEKKRTADAKV